jgi:hypothetical protein
VRSLTSPLADRLVSRRLWSAVAAGSLLALLVGTTADAGPVTGGGVGISTGDTQGGAGNDKLTAGVHTRIVVDGGRRSGGSGTSAPADITPDGNWTPPACWWEPQWTPEQLKGLGDFFDAFLGVVGFPGRPFQTQYGDYNVGKDGRWWAPVKNPNREGDPATEACTGIFWADTKTVPKVPMAVSPEVMAKYAYDELPLPRLIVEFNPAGGRQTVNLPTWIWGTDAVFKPVPVHATIPGTGLWATTTATPVSLHLDAGTPDAELFPASGDCPINADGTVGRKYTTGERGDPACGVVYQRETAPGATFPLRATITWKISWIGSDGAGGPLPAATIRDDHDMQVREIQAVGR